MITGIGVDLIDVARIEKALNKGDAFRDKVFSEKEAFLKAIGTGWRGNVHLNEIEISNDELGKPTLHLIGSTRHELIQYEAHVIHLSISHTATAATAFVIIEAS